MSDITLRSLTDKDIPLIEKWLNKDHVKRWYEIPRLGITIQDWITEIKAYKTDFKWITYLIVLYDDIPVGLCLYYQCADSIGEDFGTLPLAGSYGIDYLLGDETLLGKGIGKKMIIALTEHVFALPDAQRITADIDSDNIASQKTVTSCGFTLVDANKSRYVICKINLQV